MGKVSIGHCLFLKAIREARGVCISCVLEDFKLFMFSV